MGFPSDKHIRAFVRGKVIADLKTDTTGGIILEFTCGEFLVLQPWAKQPERPAVEVIATPMRADRSVKQVTEIDYSQVE